MGPALSPLYRWTHWDLDRWHMLPMAINGTWTPACQIPKLKFLTVFSRSGFANNKEHFGFFPALGASEKKYNKNKARSSRKHPREVGGYDRSFRLPVRYNSNSVVCAPGLGQQRCTSLHVCTHMWGLGVGRVLRQGTGWASWESGRSSLSASRLSVSCCGITPVLGGILYVPSNASLRGSSNWSVPPKQRGS